MSLTWPIAEFVGEFQVATDFGVVKVHADAFLGGVFSIFVP